MFCATRWWWRRSSRACRPSSSSAWEPPPAAPRPSPAAPTSRAGVIFQPFDQDKETPPRFLTGHATGTSELVHGADLVFLPGPSASEETHLRRVGSDPDCGFAVLHSAGGLLLCSRGRVRALHLYVCNPVTCQWVALPELPLPVCKRHCGHLTVATDDGDGAAARAFKVVLVNHSNHWHGPGGQLDLRVFHSDTGRWEAKRFPATFVISDDLESCLPQMIGQSQSGISYWISDDVGGGSCLPPMLGQSGTSYWTWCATNFAVAYNSVGAGDSLKAIKLPKYPDGTGWNRCIGERHGGGIRYMESDRWMLQVWDAQGGGHGGTTWTLVHRVGTAELVARNPGAAAFLRNKYASTWDHHHFKPAGVHPTDDGVIFLVVPGAVVAYPSSTGR
ncbi:hypothetical protein C2845_PM08G15810 [Panicum miliaceum]|uniref:F-box protein At3g26010-like beta-propeller domain-containing protein n=1 Tax=Panicum miliaceum TaxID=4540 RepID=A0A3L6R023_PANMI|nr:hypothetical protein C2845_PM08G15810 [Panicum miliaceum]